MKEDLCVTGIATVVKVNQFGHNICSPAGHDKEKLGAGPAAAGSCSPHPARVENTGSKCPPISR